MNNVKNSGRRGAGLILQNIKAREMASTSLVSSARATPRERRDTPNAAVLPKIGVLSTDNFSSASPQQDERNFNQAENLVPQAGTEPSHLLSAAPEIPKGGPDANLGTQGLVTAAIKELALDIDQSDGRSLHGIRGGFVDVSTTRPLPKGSQTQSSAVKSPNTPPGGNNRSKLKQLVDSPRQRHLTWPSLKYKVWIDTSNLSLYRLTADHRIARPCSIKSRQCKAEPHPESMTTPNRGRTNSGRMFRNEWRVNSSQANRQHAPRNTYLEKMIIPGTEEGFGGVHEALTIPRLPSRMGRNSLHHYVENSKDGSLRASIVSRVGPRVRLPEAKKAQSAPEATTQLHHDSKMAILKLRGLVRNPMLAEHAEGQRMVDNRKLENKKKQDSKKRDVRKKKHLSFSIPSGSELKEIDHKVNNGVGAVGISVLPSEAQFDNSFHVLKYISTKTQ